MYRDFSRSMCRIEPWSSTHEPWNTFGARCDELSGNQIYCSDYEKKHSMIGSYFISYFSY